MTTPQYIINFRRQDGFVDQIEAANEASLGGHIAHLMYDYEEFWVRENPGGAIVMVYEKRGSLNRPSRGGRA